MMISAVGQADAPPNLDVSLQVTRNFVRLKLIEKHLRGVLTVSLIFQCNWFRFFRCSRSSFVAAINFSTFIFKLWLLWLLPRVVVMAFWHQQSSRGQIDGVIFVSRFVTLRFYAIFDKAISYLFAVVRLNYSKNISRSLANLETHATLI